METLSRRSFLAVSAGAAGTAAFLVAPGVAAATGAEDKSRSSSKPRSDGDGSDLIVLVRAGGKGEIVIYSGENEITVNDRNLASAIARSAKGKG